MYIEISRKIDKYGFLTGENILPPEQRRVIEQAKFTFSPLRKALEKQIRTIEDQVKKQIKALEEHRKQLFESNELIKKGFNINRDRIPLEKEKKIFNEIVEEKFYEFQNKKSDWL